MTTILANDLSEREKLKRQMINSWRESSFRPSDENNNNSSVVDPVAEAELIFLSTNVLDATYKSKRLRLADSKNPAFKLREVHRPAPIRTTWDFMARILKLSDFKFSSQLGRGSFGVVFASEVSEGNGTRKLAVKVIQTSKDGAHSKQLSKSYLAELNIKHLRHPNLVYQLGSNPSDALTNNAFIVYEFAGKYNLNQYLLDPEVEMNAQKRRSFSVDLMRALEFIHANNIVHMDLKPANVIVSENLVCKLTDFGCSVKLGQEALASNSESLLSEPFDDNRWTAGTWFYRAPELFRKDKQVNVTTKCDIYSLGIVMWQLLTRESPYHAEHEDPHVIIYQIVTRNLRPRFPGSFLIPPSSSNHTSPKSFISRSISPMSRNTTTKTMTSSSSAQLISSVSSISISSPSKQAERLSNTDKSKQTNAENSSGLFKLSSHSSFLSNKPKPISGLFKTNVTVDSNQTFERVYRSLIEQSWSDDPIKRFDAKQLKEVLLNTKISY